MGEGCEGELVMPKQVVQTKLDESEHEALRAWSLENQIRPSSLISILVDRALNNSTNEGALRNLTFNRPIQDNTGRARLVCARVEPRAVEMLKIRAHLDGSSLSEFLRTVVINAPKSAGMASRAARLPGK